MRRSSLVIALALVAGLAGCDQADFVLRPPERYQRNAGVEVRFADTGYACKGASLVGEPGTTAIGCYLGGVIYLPNPCTWPDAYAQLACHELAHANGWPGDHPD